MSNAIWIECLTIWMVLNWQCIWIGSSVHCLPCLSCCWLWPESSFPKTGNAWNNVCFVISETYSGSLCAYSCRTASVGLFLEQSESSEMSRWMVWSCWWFHSVQVLRYVVFYLVRVELTALEKNDLKLIVPFQRKCLLLNVGSIFSQMM